MTDVKTQPSPDDPPGDRDLRKDQLREAGLRATASRVAVLSLLHASSSPLSHADVVERLQDGAWDKATLYRNLLDFVRVGLARRSDLGDHVWRFELVTDHSHEPFAHPHFICTDCGDVECMPGLAVALRKREGIPSAVRHREVDVQIRGVCDRCRHS